MRYLALALAVGNQAAAIALVLIVRPRPEAEIIACVLASALAYIAFDEIKRNAPPR